MTAMTRIIFTLIISFLLLLLSTSSVNAQVVINEFLPNPTSGNDWVELYSPSDVDISGWVLDDEGTASDMATIPQGITIGPSTSSFYVIEVSNRLNQSEDSVYLLQTSGGTQVDFKNYNYNPGTDVSFGRYPDGGVWGTCVQTKSLTNSSCTFPTPTSTVSPTPVITQAPTAIPTATPTKTPTPVPTKTPTPKPTKTASSEPEVLGEATTPEPDRSTPTSSPLVADSTKKKFPLVPVILISSGLLMVGFAVLQLVRASKNPVQT